MDFISIIWNYDSKDWKKTNTNEGNVKKESKNLIYQKNGDWFEVGKKKKNCNRPHCRWVYRLDTKQTLELGEGCWKNEN